MTPAAHGAALATIRLPATAPIAMPAEAQACRRARIGLPSRRSIRAPSAFIVTSTTPPTNPDAISVPATTGAVVAFKSAQRAAPKASALSDQDLSRAEAMRQRAAGRHGDQIGSRIHGKNDAEGGRIDAGAGENRAGSAAPQANSDA